MKHIPVKILLVLIVSTLLNSCVKDADDNPFFIEAEINGVKWRGNLTGEPSDGYLAVGDNNSKMKLWINTGAVSTFNFFSYTPANWNTYLYKDTTLLKYIVGAFDSKMKVKLETSFENDIDRFQIELTKYPFTNPMVYTIVGSIPASGTSATSKQYSLALNNIDLQDLDYLWYRIKIITKSGAYNYTPTTAFKLFPGKALIGRYTSDKKLYMALDNDQNEISLTATGPEATEKTGTFSFNYLNEAGDTLRVKNGKFHVK